MATCKITAVDIDDIRASLARPGATEAVSFTSSTQSSAFTTNGIRVDAVDADVYLAFGENPTADADDLRVPSGTIEYFLVTQGEKVACYDGTT